MTIRIFVGVPCKENTQIQTPKDWVKTIYKGRRFVGKRLSSPSPSAQEIHESAKEIIDTISQNRQEEALSTIAIFPELLSGI